MPPSTLFDFTAAPDAAAAWRSLDDPVMGGVSESQFIATEGGAAFTGEVSLEQGGGFCSVRGPALTEDLRGAHGLRPRLRGDGKHYWLTMYTEAGGSLSYRASLQPPADWTPITVPFDALTAYRRGSHVPDAPPFAPDQVRTLGFLIADEQAGPFRLEIAQIQAV